MFNVHGYPLFPLALLLLFGTGAGFVSLLTSFMSLFLSSRITDNGAHAVLRGVDAREEVNNANISVAPGDADEADNVQVSFTHFSSVLPLVDLRLHFVCILSLKLLPLHIMILRQ